MNVCIYIILSYKLIVFHIQLLMIHRSLKSCLIFLYFLKVLLHCISYLISSKMNFQKCSNDFESLVYRIRSNPTTVHPKFSSFSSRFKTFKLFPSNTSQNKYTLSECGLKYSGVDDVVECFCCGLILHNWERLDDPWIEHCRFSPRCLYVLLMKGNHYVQNVLSKYCKTEHIHSCEYESYDTVC